MCVREDVEIHVLNYELRSLKKIKYFANWKNRFQTRAYYENNLMVYRCHAWNIIPTKYKLGEDLWVRASYKLFKRYIKSYGIPDVIHVQSAFPAAKVVGRIKKEYNIPFFINEHSSRVRLGTFSPKEKKYYEDIFRSARFIIAVSETFGKLIERRFSTPLGSIRIIPNFINADFFSPDKTVLKSGLEMRFLAVCFLEKNKQIDRLLDAFYQAFKLDKNVKLVIGGDGSEKENIINKIKDYNLQDQVTLTGSLSQEQVRDQMRLCDCFVLASKTETFGVVLIEAMAVGKPVIATRSGGPEDFVTNQVGILAENNLDSIKEALLEMRENIDNYHPETIRGYIMRNFSSESTSNRVIELYKEILMSSK